MKSYSTNLLWHHEITPLHETYAKIFEDAGFTTRVDITYHNDTKQCSCYVNSVLVGETGTLTDAEQQLNDRLDFNINLHYRLTAKQPTTTEDILYNLAVEFGYGHYSTRNPFEIDYKFWDDAGAERIATALAKKLSTALS